MKMLDIYFTDIDDVHERAYQLSLQTVQGTLYYVSTLEGNGSIGSIVLEQLLLLVLTSKDPEYRANVSDQLLEAMDTWENNLGDEYRRTINEYQQKYLEEYEK